METIPEAPLPAVMAPRQEARTQRAAHHQGTLAGARVPASAEALAGIQVAVQAEAAADSQAAVPDPAVAAAVAVAAEGNMFPICANLNLFYKYLKS